MIASRLHGNCEPVGIVAIVTCCNKEEKVTADNILARGGGWGFYTPFSLLYSLMVTMYKAAML